MTVMKGARTARRYLFLALLLPLSLSPTLAVAETSAEAECAGTLADSGQACYRTFVLGADHVSYGVEVGGLLGVSGVAFTAAIWSATAQYKITCVGTVGFPSCDIDFDGDFIRGQDVHLWATGVATAGQWRVYARESDEPS